MSARYRIVLVGILTLGLALRGYHYFREPSMWHDEAAVAVNVLDRGYAELLGPLTFHEAAPPLFLWLEKTVCLVLGDGVFALRLPAFLASCAALPLLAWAACRLLEPRAALWVLFLFAVSESLAWHACEAKPYAFDVLAAVVLVTLHTTSLGRRLILSAAAAPVLIFLSYPAIFLYGGVLAAAAPAVWRERKPSAWAAYGLLAAAVAAAFLTQFLGPIRAPHDPVIASCWTGAFPDWNRPWFVPLWAIISTLDVCRYCCKPLGPALLPLAVAGAVVLWRRGRRGLVGLLVAPVLLALAAAFAQRYPFGGARVLVYAAPAFVLLVGAGTPPAWDWLRRRHRLAPAALALLFLPPLYAAVHLRRLAVGPGGHGRRLRLRRSRGVSLATRSRATTGRTSITSAGSAPRSIPSLLPMQRIAAGLFTRRSSPPPRGSPAPSEWGRPAGLWWSGAKTSSPSPPCCCCNDRACGRPD